MPYCTTLNRRKIFEIFLGMTKPDGGLVMAGSEAVFDAARSDLFATRPGLAAQIDAKNGLWGAPLPLSACLCWCCRVPFLSS